MFFFFSCINRWLNTYWIRIRARWLLFGIHVLVLELHRWRVLVLRRCQTWSSCKWIRQLTLWLFFKNWTDVLVVLLYLFFWIGNLSDIYFVILYHIIVYIVYTWVFLFFNSILSHFFEKCIRCLHFQVLGKCFDCFLWHIWLKKHCWFIHIPSFLFFLSPRLNQLYGPLLNTLLVWMLKAWICIIFSFLLK